MEDQIFMDKVGTLLGEWEKLSSSPYVKELMVGKPPSPWPLHVPSNHEIGLIAGWTDAAAAASPLPLLLPSIIPYGVLNYFVIEEDVEPRLPLY